MRCDSVPFQMVQTSQRSDHMFGDSVDGDHPD